METNLPILRPKKCYIFRNLFLVIVLEVKERYLQIFWKKIFIAKVPVIVWKLNSLPRACDAKFAEFLDSKK